MYPKLDVRTKTTSSEKWTYYLTPSTYFNLDLAVLVAGPSFQHHISSPNTFNCSSSFSGKSRPLCSGALSTTHLKSEGSSHILAPTRAYMAPPPSISHTSSVGEGAGESKLLWGVERPDIPDRRLHMAELVEEDVDGRELG